MLTGYDDLPTAENAKHDRIKLSQKSWTIHNPSEEALAEFARRLRTVRTGTDALTFENFQTEEDPSDSTGWIFVAARNHGKPWLTRLSVRKKPQRARTHGFGFPLFGGAIEIKKPPRGWEGPAIITSNIYLNPTRFARWQSMESSSDPIFWKPRCRIRTREADRSLNRNDNYLLQGQYSRFNEPETWRNLIRDYWAGVLEKIEEEFSRAATAAEVTVRRTVGERHSTSIKEMEVYWEKESHDALAELARIGPILRGLGSRSTESSYPSLVRGLEYDCPSFTIELCGGIFLKVYAKTPTRIRFEVSYKLGDVNCAFEGRISGLRPTILNQVCNEITIDAASRLAPIFPLLRESLPQSITLMDFFNALHSSASSTEQANSILQILVSNDSISTGSKNTNRRRTIEKLIRRGVLEKTSIQGGRAILTDHYRLVLEEAFSLPQS